MEREEREIWERKKKVGSVCFGFKLIPKILFCKCGCLVAHGKYIFRKCFSVWSCVGCKMISVFILSSNIIFWKIERESESEIVPAHKERERKRQREREREEEERAHRRRPISLRLHQRPRDFAPWTQIVVRLRHSTSTLNRTHWLRWRT